jgi:hypothetical protein
MHGLQNNSPTVKIQSILTYILLAVVLAVVVYVRIRLLQVPLERDEGEYAYAGQLILKGISPYAYAYTMKLPGTSLAYAFLMMVFGQTPAGIHLGLLLVNGLCIVLVYTLARRLFSNDAALVSAASFAFLSLSQSVLGIFAHATHFVVMFALAGLILLLRSLDKGRIALLFASGLCFGLSFTMKQHAALLIIFALVYLVQHTRSNSDVSKKNFFAGIILFLLGTIVPYALIAVWMWQAGTFSQFWFWTVRYAREYASSTTLVNGLITLFFQTAVIIIPQFPLWLLTIAGAGLLMTKHGRNLDRSFIFGYFFFSLLAICPGFYFREHYYILLLPAVALLAGTAVQAIESLAAPRPEGYRRFIPIILFAASFAYGLLSEKNYFFSLSPQSVCRAIYHQNPFPEALEISRYIKEHTSPDDRIAVLGSEPEIYFYADRLSATGHIYMYGLMENQPHAEQMQMQMIHEVERAKPKYIVTVNVASSWLVQSFSKQTIINWGKSYLKDRYDTVGVIEVDDSGMSHYLWDDQVAGHSPIAGSSIIVYKRKTG